MNIENRKEMKTMALSQLFDWNTDEPSNTNGTACGASDPEEPSTACGTACGAGE